MPPFGVAARPAPRPHRWPVAIAPALACVTALTLLTGCGSSTGQPIGAPATSIPAAPGAATASGGAPSTGAPTPSRSAPAAPGAYIDYAAYAQDPRSYAAGTVVLSFHAPWCPVCRRIEQEIQAGGVPAGFTFVKVDYDSATDLKVKYGVTVQHTFVRVDASGTAIGRPVSDAPNLAAVVEAVA